jgi:hypothetical protein
MTVAKQKAEQIIKAVESGESIQSIESRLATTPDEWHRFSSKAYIEYLNIEKIKRKADEKRPHVSCTSNNDTPKKSLNASIKSFDTFFI